MSNNHAAGAHRDCRVSIVALPMIAAAALATVLAGCKEKLTAGQLAERRYEMVKKRGNIDETCAAARLVANAYLEGFDNDGYRWWSVVAEGDCLDARLERLS